MLLKGLYHNFHLRIAVFVLLTIAGTYLALRQEWVWFVPVLSIWAFLLRLILLSDKRNAQKVAFMFDAIDNSDYAFRYATRGRSSNDKLVSESLNRITQIPLRRSSSRLLMTARPTPFKATRPKRMPPRKKNTTS